MTVFRNDESGTWYSTFHYRYETGKRRHKTKRGFKTEGEAHVWEREFLAYYSEAMEMTLADFVVRYLEDLSPRLKLNTLLTKQHIIEKKILPTFGRMRMSDITGRDILRWQNALMDGDDASGYSPTYLRTINSQLSAIFNHAVRFYGLRKSPMLAVPPMGEKKPTEMLFWTKDEYLRFSRVAMDKPESFHAFELLYWCGIRLGELLALTPADFDFDANILHITKSYQRIRGQDVITEPKTRKSVRTIVMPSFLCEEIEEYVRSIYGLGPDERIFMITKSFLHNEMKRCSEAAGVKKIRVHDLRHSHVSLLIDMGYTPLAIAERLGHESIDITYRYAHLFPDVQHDMANSLEVERGEF